jgi:hypothetical protein
MQADFDNPHFFEEDRLWDAAVETRTNSDFQDRGENSQSPLPGLETVAYGEKDTKHGIPNA